MNMKIIKNYIYFLLSLLVITGCSNDDIGVTDENIEGDFIRATVRTDIPGYTMNRSGVDGFSDNCIQTLSVLVFDNETGFEYKTEAKESDKPHHFDVTLKTSSDLKTLHYIANYDWSSIKLSDYVGAPEDELIPMLTSSNALKDRVTMWFRDPDVKPNEYQTGLGYIKMVRSIAKINICVKNPDKGDMNKFLITKAWLYNSAEEAMVAPYKPGEGFDEDYVSPDYSVNTENPVVLFENDTPVESFTEFINERGISNADEFKPFVVVGGILETESSDRKTIEKECFYKLDLYTNEYTQVVHNKDGEKTQSELVRKPIQLKRNTVTSITLHSFGEGYSTLAEAAEGRPSNDVSLGTEFAEANIVYNSKSMLKVDPTFILITDPKEAQEFEINVESYNMNADEGDYNKEANFEYTIIESENEQSRHIIGSNMKEDNKITFFTNKFWDKDAAVLDYQEAFIKIKAHDSDLFRTVKVVRRNPFVIDNIMLNGSKEPLIEGRDRSPVTLSFDIPADCPTSIFPMDLRIDTKYLSPERGSDILVKTEDREKDLISGKDDKSHQYDYNGVTTYFIYKVGAESIGKTINLPFRTNRAYDHTTNIPSEEVRLTMNHFETAYIGYNQQYQDYVLKAQVSSKLGLSTDLIKKENGIVNSFKVFRINDYNAGDKVSDKPKWSSVTEVYDGPIHIVTDNYSTRKIWKYESKRLRANEGLIHFTVPKEYVSDEYYIELYYDVSSIKLRQCKYMCNRDYHFGTSSFGDYFTTQYLLDRMDEAIQTKADKFYSIYFGKDKSKSKIKYEPKFIRP